MTWRRLIGQPRTDQPVDFRRHAEILNDLRNMTERIRSGDPLASMVRGTWRPDNKDENDDESQTRD